MVDLGPEGLRGVEEHPFAPLRDLRTVRGALKDLTEPECFSEDYVYAELTDEEALADPVGALRITYPNLIGMRVRNSRTIDGLAQAEAEVEAAERRTPLEHFTAFYQMQNNGTPPDERRLRMMRQVIEEAEAKRHEAGQA